MVVKLPFALKKAFFCLFGLKQAWLPNHSFFGIYDWVMRTQLFKSCKMTPL